jgi:hypothetical protein
MNAKKKAVLGGVLILVVATVGFLGWYFGKNKDFPYEPARRARYHAMANELYDKKGQAAEDSLGDNPDSPALREAAGQNHAARIEKEHNDRVIDQVDKSCPADYKYEADRRITADITACSPGQAIWLQLFNQFQTERYSVKLYKYGHNGKLIEVRAQPVIKVLREQNPDGFSIAKEVSNVFDLRGEVVFIPQGDADFLELIRR